MRLADFVSDAAVQVARLADKTREPVVVNNVAIPLVLDDYFIAPDLIEALEYYHNWRRDAEPEMSFQGYLCTILKEIDRRRPNGYTSDKTIGELMCYVGLKEFARLLGEGRR